MWADIVNLIGSAPEQLTGFVSQVFLTGIFALFLIGVLVLERVRPAARSQSMLSRGFAFDLGICLVSLVVNFFVLALMMALLFGLYRQTLPTPGLLVADWPLWLKIVVVFTANDATLWLSHRIRHRVPALWRFHAFHHSQRELNLFTEFRLHPVDQAANTILISLPFYLCQVPYETTVAWMLAQKYYLMFVHSNVDIGYGPLDRVFVSPRIHRLHHSMDEEYRDRNYGVLLTVWDVAFRTFARPSAVPPATGVAEFPDEHDARWYRLPFIYLRQLLSPFSPSPRR